MRIANVEALPIRLPAYDAAAPSNETERYRTSRANGTAYANRPEALFVRVETDEGTIGWGEALAPVAPEATGAWIEKFLKELLIGKDPRNPRALWREMYDSMRVRGNTTGVFLDAIAALDIAMWDLKGKSLGVPVWSLLGGKVRDEIPVYVSGLSGANEGQKTESALAYMEAGFSAFKGVPLTEAFRDAVGPDAVLLYDALWRFTLDEAIAFSDRLRELQVAFFECPLAPEAIDDHRTLRKKTSVPVALGEAERTRYQFKELLVREAADFLQPDVGRTGISEFQAIAELGEAFHRRIAPHSSSGLGVCIAASIHASAAAPNLYMLEWKPNVFESANRLLLQPLTCKGGALAIPHGPGLGVEPDYAALKQLVI
ncbi:mandelate racemase/muconate lactonizing enzyme family protein [Paenibacillus antri]|uniref:Mandelate racemase/muconate lactonizing enzyme family protein n=1 Tax=Paenibacillus antri TaxID=2582848 RepID=A0A5R9G7K3_9BACL|nr:mandelate racemase/muconate lactonizing enzyme family protein [Paenibacillus antri]TLS49004.1 mandelate racemase/muconate lactonizing enzyme family protein [Paenibacillus antri]